MFILNQLFYYLCTSNYKVVYTKHARWCDLVICHIQTAESPYTFFKKLFKNLTATCKLQTFKTKSRAPYKYLFFLSKVTNDKLKSKEYPYL